MSELVTEEEQVEAMKKWWAENGKSVIGGIVIGLSVIFGWDWWGNYQQNQQEQSSSYYQQLSFSAMQGKTEAVDKLFSRLQEQAPNSAYLMFAAMDIAKQKVTASDFEAARVYLQRAVDSGTDEGLLAVARLRLARVLLEMKKYDEALSALSASIPSAMAAEAAAVRGDIELAKGNADAARAAYSEALAGEVANADIVKMKLDNLGAAKAS